MATEQPRHAEKFCLCGLLMVPVHTGVLLACPNCDAVQASELNDGPGRVRTTWDRKFALAWEQLKRKYYPGGAS